MSWLADNRRDALFIFGTLALPVVLVVSLLASLMGTRSEYQSEIDYLEPRIARLVGLKQEESALAAAAGRVDSDVLGLVYPLTDDKASVSASLQKNVRDIFSDAGMSITSSQMLPSKQDAGLEHIPVKVTAAGPLDALDAALSALQQYRPLLMVESMEVFPSRGASARGAKMPQQITATLQILALRQAE